MKIWKLILPIFFALILAGPVSQALQIDSFVSFLGVAAVQYSALHFVPLAKGQLNTLVGVMTTGAGVITPVDLPYVPSFILVGTTDTDLPVQGITTAVKGVTIQEITDQTVIQAFSKLFMGGMLGADVKVAQIWKVSGGQIDLRDGQKFRINLENAGATTPNIYAYSPKTGKEGELISIGQDSINARGNALISGVTSVAFEDTNFSKAELVYQDGHVESDLTLVELASMLVQDFTTDADGKLAGVNVINLTANGIVSVKLYAGTGGSLAYYTWTIGA
ncbi:MAG: hypothetical protein RLO17_14660 [Cyclobacteriaceae bacterium]